jgi:NADH-quinone oxidoreductase subunit H
MIVRLVVFGVKTFGFILVFMLVRWTIPRFRFDQLMALAWKVAIPLAALNLVCLLCIKQLDFLGDYAHWLMLPLSVLLLIGAAYLTLLSPREELKTRWPVTFQHGRPVATGRS